MGNTHTWPPHINRCLSRPLTYYDRKRKKCNDNGTGINSPSRHNHTMYSPPAPPPSLRLNPSLLQLWRIHWHQESIESFYQQLRFAFLWRCVCFFILFFFLCTVNLTCTAAWSRLIPCLTPPPPPPRECLCFPAIADCVVVFVFR